MPSGTLGAPTIDTHELRTFAEEVFEPLQRADQRRWAHAYLGALLSVPGKKTLQRLAKAVSPAPAAAHGLQQFINASPWDWGPVRRSLARTVAGRGLPRAWTVKELTIPKRGEHSVGVHRRFDVELGRTVNCQLAMGLFLAADIGCVPVDWSLLLERSWCADEERRARARIPESVTARPAWRHILDFATDVAANPGLSGIPWVLDLRRTDDAGAVVEGLARRGLDFVCEVSPAEPVVPASAVASAAALGELMARGHMRQPQVVVRQAATGRLERLTVHFGEVRLPGRAGEPSGVPRVYRALARPSGAGRLGVRYWLTSLTDWRAEEVLGLARHASAVEPAVRDLGHFGVQDFEGRSFPGWHHHMTMASAAHAFARLRASGPAPALAAPDRACA
ncbi:IS701 family transposase [Streptomyces sp. NPDC015171]|uniref:IS701 family transposase n=1 Tax=Streptomyces sp. NPDC015171 TaxID=3364945 RepID=UPI0037010464